ncbi:MAG TPA: DUF6056 family protein [Kofleriaceae bacterium]|nr:DUF6056 family protein [Kofleriaceae bacterium]
MSARSAFFSLLVVLTITLAVICACEPIEGDAWGHYFAAQQSFSWDHFVAVAKGSYLHGNPRWGQLVLATMFHAPIAAAVISALIIVAVLLLSMALIRARWPRSRDPADGWLLVQVLATAILTTPQFGAIWFYRPNCTNYVYPLALQLAWLVPYRFLAARPMASPWWLAFAMVPLGLLAGAGNEHTGVGLAVAAVVLTYIAWSRDRTLPVWSITGVLALAGGYAALLLAPGQHERYGGLANQQGTFERIADRGVLGNLSIIGVLVAWLSPTLVGTLALAGRRIVRVPPRAIVGFLAIAAVMIATTLAAPKVPIRLLAAPATMVALALGVFLVELATDRVKARWLRIASLAVSSLALATTLTIFVVTGIEGRARLHTLETAPPAATVCTPPYTFAAPSPFSWGDDFRSPHLRKRIAQAYGIAQIDWTCAR